MPLQRGEVTIGAATFEVEPFEFPAAEVRTIIHETQSGVIAEIDAVPTPAGRKITLRGTERTGWYRMTDAVRTYILAQYALGISLTLTDWRGNSATVVFTERPTFEDIGAVGFWAFEMNLVAVT